MTLKLSGQYRLRSMFLSVAIIAGVTGATSGAFGGVIQRLSWFVAAVVASYLTAIIVGAAPWLAHAWLKRAV